MEGSGRNLVSEAQDAQPGSQLGGGLTGEGEGQNASGVAAAGEGTPGDAAGKYARLARACSGVDGEGNGIAGDRVGLCLVEAVKQGVGDR